MQVKSKPRPTPAAPGGGGGKNRIFGPAVDFARRISYHGLNMMRSSFLAFPLLFALLTLALFLFLYPPAAGAPGWLSAGLVFLTALGWSALIVFGRREMHGLKVFYASAALLASIVLTWFLRPFPADPLQHGLMVVLQALGMAGIILYLSILKKNRGNANE